MTALTTSFHIWDVSSSILQRMLYLWSLVLTSAIVFQVTRYLKIVEDLFKLVKLIAQI